ATRPIAAMKATARTGTIGAMAAAPARPANCAARAGTPLSLARTAHDQIWLRTLLRPSRRRFAPPQDDGVLRMALKKNVILRSPRSGRLEGREGLLPAAR